MLIFFSFLRGTRAIYERYVGRVFDTPALEYHWDFLFRSVMSAEFLLLNGAKINAADFKGNTSLHLAASHGSTGQVKYAK